MPNSLQINPVSFIRALSTVLELSNVGISNHHTETAIIAKAFGRALKLPDIELQNLVYASLLHDIGAASDWDEKHLIVHNDDSSHVFRHAEAGCKILRKSPQLREISEFVLYHHDRYDGGNPSGLSGMEIPLISRIIHISDRIDVLIQKNVYIFTQRDQIVTTILSSPHFDPILKEVFLALSKKESFWLNIVTSGFNAKFLNDLDFFGKMYFDIDDMISIAEIFSTIVDATSAYTARHSINVAEVAQKVAELSSYSAEEAKMFYLAGLLHDLGKLAIPNAILDNPAKLNDQEFDVVKQHPYYSRLILQQIDGFETIAQWVGQHHETYDGKGYPDKLTTDEISLGGRIIQISDVICALVEKRPYRESMSAEQAIDTMQSMARDHRLDPKMVELVRININDLLPFISK